MISYPLIILRFKCLFLSLAFHSDQYDWKVPLFGVDLFDNDKKRPLIVIRRAGIPRPSETLSVVME